MKMGYREIFDDIKKNQVGRLYLFYGEEEYVKEQAMLQLTRALVPPHLMELNYQVLDGNIVHADDIIHASETLPFMAQARLVVVKDLALFHGKKAKAEEEQLKNYLKHVPDTTCLVFNCRDKIDKRKSLYKTINKLGKAIEFAPLKQGEIFSWVRSTLKKHGKQMEPNALKHFVYIGGNKLEELYTELVKLISYAEDTPFITREAVEKVVTPTMEYTIFQLVEAIGTRETGTALILLDRLLSEGENVFAILAMISRQIRLIFQCKGQKQQGLSHGQITKKLGIHPYVAKKCLQQSKYFTMEQLKMGLAECLKVDYGIKSGKIKDRLGLEVLIIKMCENQKAS